MLGTDPVATRVTSDQESRDIPAGEGARIGQFVLHVREDPVGCHKRERPPAQAAGEGEMPGDASVGRSFIGADEIPPSRTVRV